ncbi:MAG: DUF4012 domain-containing protein [Acidimicrobiales bacterium]|nr:DUF4012 domain-containing protein [Acidimicrobiales bacterium]
MSSTTDPPPQLRPAPRVRPRDEAARRRSRGRRRRTDAQERVAIYVVAAAAGLAAALAATTMVVPNGPLAALWRFALAGGVALAGSRARRWTWLVVGGVGVLVSTEVVWLAVAGAGVGVAFASIFVPRRRILGAISVGLSVQPLFHVPDLGGDHLATWAALAAVAPVLGSAYLVSPRRVRRRVHRAVLAVVAAAAVGAVLAGAAALLGYGAANRGADAAFAGMSKVRDGDTAAASGELREATDAFTQAEGAFAAPWTWPAAAVPGVAQHLDALATMSREGRAVSASAAAVTEQVDYDALRYQDGRIDVAAVQAVQDPLAGASSTFAAAQAAMADQRGALLLPAVGGAVDRFADELDTAAPQASTASAAAELAPGLLGADGPRRYAVLLTTPAELRGLGGFVGSWLILEADGGEVRLVDSFRTADLNERPGRDERAVRVPEVGDPNGDDPLDAAEQARLADYANRYGRFQVGRYLQDVAVSPDLPSVGGVVEQLLPQTGEAPIDGVIVADPAGVAALLELTGPIELSDLGMRLDADNVEDFLLRDQYEQFPDRDAREDLLEAVGRATFDALVSGSLPSPRQLGEVVAPAVAGGHLGMWSTHPDEAALLAELGADAAFPSAAGGDLLSVRTQNKGNNKIDVFARRDVAHRVRFDPETGATDATVRVTLHNDAPSEGLSDAVIGSNDQGLPPGTNVSFVSVYTPLGLRGARIDGLETGLEFQRELGVSVYSLFVTIPPGGSVELVLDLHGDLEPGDYRLVLAPQPTVTPDEYDLTLEPSSGWLVDTLLADGDITTRTDTSTGRASASGDPDEVVRLTAEFVEG